MQPLKSLVREVLDKTGYRVTHKKVLPFGIDPLWDIQRLSARHKIHISRAFDIGAHIGETATGFLSAFPNAEVYSFEPHPNSFNCLLDIKSDRFHAYRLAISDRNGDAQFFVYSDVVDPTEAVSASMQNSLVRQTQFELIADGTKTTHHTKTINVECMTVDQFCDTNNLKKVEVLKIDVEGHEAEVLDGARDTLLNRGVRFVLLEFATINPLNNAVGGALAPTAGRLEPLGFRFIASYPVLMLDKPLYASFDALFLATGDH
jgi:FkbM family methyltransferase